MSYWCKSSDKLVFEHVDQGIILEDDCIAHPDFFSFTSELLDFYKNDKRIWCISGNNFQEGKWHGDEVTILVNTLIVGAVIGKIDDLHKKIYQNGSY